MAAVAGYLQEQWRLLTVSDPGGLRLRKAATVAMSAALAMGVLAAIATALGEPITVALLGTVIAVQSAAAVKDRTQRARVLTTVAIPVPAIAAVVLATTLQSFGAAAEAGFICVLFGAVWVRRWGPRGEALGMVAFIAYFFSLFLHTGFDDVPILCVAIVLGVVCTLVIRVIVLPERPRAEIRRLAGALRAASTEAVRAGGMSDDDAEPRLRRRLDGFGRTALMIEDWIDRHDNAALVTVTGRSLSMTVFDAQIATEQLAGALRSLGPGRPWPAGLRQAVGALDTVLDDRAGSDVLRAALESSGRAARDADPSTAAGIATMVAHRAVQAHVRIHRVAVRASSLFGAGLRWGPGLARPEPEPAAPARPPEAEAGAPAPGTDTSHWHPSTRAAIQVAVATSAATVLGELVSPDRWYWAVLTAFLVFNGASTRGEILSRAGHRVVGTVAGVIAGVVIAALVGHDPPLQMTLIIVCIFFAFYFAPVAYALLTFCVTVLLAMLYGLLGVFSIEVLGLRIAETAVGAVVGIASAYFILATSTQGELEDKSAAYLDRLNDVIAVAVSAVAAPGAPRDVVAATRDLDEALEAVLTAAKPLELRPAARSRRSVKRFTRVLTAVNRAAHQLARAGLMATRADASTAPSDRTAQGLREAAESVHQAVELLRAGVEGEPVRTPPRPTEIPVLAVMLSATRTPGALRLSLRSLSRLHRALYEALA